MIKAFKWLVSHYFLYYREETLKEAKAARDKGIHLLVAGVGNWLDEMELRAMATYPEDETLFRLNNFNNLDENFRTALRDIICNSRKLQ